MRLWRDGVRQYRLLKFATALVRAQQVQLDEAERIMREMQERSQAQIQWLQEMMLESQRQIRDVAVSALLAQDQGEDVREILWPLIEALSDEIAQIEEHLVTR